METADSLPPLAQVRAEVLDTVSAAFYLGVRPQTLRLWSSTESGPLQPVRGVGRHLHWRTADIRALLGMTVAQERKLRPKQWRRKSVAAAAV
jgi:hypothetical protein